MQSHNPATLYLPVPGQAGSFAATTHGKRFYPMTRTFAFLLSGLISISGPTLADGISGVFVTSPNDDGDIGHIEFSACGDAYCGTLIASFDSAGKPFAGRALGMHIVWDMKDQGGGRFSGGRIWDPGADKTYRSKMSLDGDTLNVSGCIGPICRKRVWTRLK